MSTAGTVDGEEASKESVMLPKTNEDVPRGLGTVKHINYSISDGLVRNSMPKLPLSRPLGDFFFLSGGAEGLNGSAVFMLSISAGREIQRDADASDSTAYHGWPC